MNTNNMLKTELYEKYINNMMQSNLIEENNSKINTELGKIKIPTVDTLRKEDDTKTLLLIVSLIESREHGQNTFKINHDLMTQRVINIITNLGYKYSDGEISFSKE